jgi:hypothetical protein
MENSVADIKAFAAAHFLRCPTADFNDIQAELTECLGRKLVRAERRLLTEAFRENFNQRAAALRAEEDKNYACSHSGQARTGFLVITAYSRNYKIGPLCASVNRRYCEAHGYQWQEDVLADSDMMAAISPRRSASWYKILMINRLLERELGDADGGSATGVRYIMWIDADASIIDPSLTLEQIVAEGESRDLLIGEDMHACSGSYINAGVFLLRVGAFAQQFFRDVWAREAEEKARAEWNDESYELEQKLKHKLKQHEVGQRRHYFFVRQFEQSAMQKVLRYQQQGLEFCYQQPGCTRGPGSGGSGVGTNVFRSAGGESISSVDRLHAFHTFCAENSHLPLDSPLLGRKHFPNVCVFPSWEFNSCLRSSGTLADDEEEEDEEEAAADEEEEGEEEEEEEVGGDAKEGGEGASKAAPASREHSSPRRQVDAGGGAVKPVQLHRAQRGARFIYHPAGKKNKFGLMSQVLADRGLLL